jgi:hypothetical protein
MSSRVYVAAQAGRQGKTGVKNEEEWGSTTSKAEFKAYEPAEMRNARDGPRHTKAGFAGLQTLSDRGTQPKVKAQDRPNYNWRRLQEEYPDRSAYTATEQSSLPKLSQTQGSRSSKPAWAMTHTNPIPEKKFHATTHYSQHQLEAQQARHGYFPYRDEYAPRSKRLMYELAINKASCDSVASGSTATASAYTMSSHPSAARSSAARSRSEGSLAASSHHTADSDRVIGGIAKRRAQAQFRSPALSEADRRWFAEKWENEGPAGLTTGNYKPIFYEQNCRQDIEKHLAMGHLLGGHREKDITGG